MKNKSIFKKAITAAVFLCLTFALSGVEALTTEQIQNGNVTIAGHNIAYEWQGQGKNILLLHGLFGSKEQWNKSFPYLVQNGFHVVALDLPGYGKSLGYPLQDYALDRQVELLHQFVQQLKLQQINIAGNSMGGLIAALYAQKYPTEVSTLAIIGAPLGIHSPKESPTTKLLKNGINPFIPLTEQEFKREMALLFVNKPNIDPKTMQLGLTRYNQEKNKDYKVWDIVQKYNSVLDKPFAIKVPTLIIWGNLDKIFDVSGAVLLHKNIKNSELKVFPGGGHLLFMENPKNTMDYYLAFLQRNKRS